MSDIERILYLIAHPEITENEYPFNVSRRTFYRDKRKAEYLSGIYDIREVEK